MIKTSKTLLLHKHHHHLKQSIRTQSSPAARSFVEEAQASEQQAPPPVAAENEVAQHTNPRIDAAIQSLKQCKAQGLTYYDATQALAKQGFGQGEIEQASTQFTYSDAATPNVGSVPQDAGLNQEFAKAAAKEEV